MNRAAARRPARSADFLTPFADEIRLQTAGVTVNKLREAGKTDEEITAHRARWERREQFIDRWIRMDCPASGFDAFLIAEQEAVKYVTAAGEPVPPACAAAERPEESMPLPAALPPLPIPAPDPVQPPPAEAPSPIYKEEEGPEPPEAPVAAPEAKPSARAAAFGLREALLCSAAGLALGALPAPGGQAVAIVDEGRVALEAALLGPEAIESRSREILSGWVARDGVVIVRRRSALAYPAQTDRTGELLNALKRGTGEGGR